MLTGEVDLTNADVLERVVDCIVLDERRIDLSECSFFDRHALLAVDRAAQRAGTRVELLGVSPLVRRVWELFGPEHVVVAR
jgi:anti-anti-sigma regulatory factor